MDHIKTIYTRTNFDGYIIELTDGRTFTVTGMTITDWQTGVFRDQYGDADLHMLPKSIEVSHATMRRENDPIPRLDLHAQGPEPDSSVLRTPDGDEIALPDAELLAIMLARKVH